MKKIKIFIASSIDELKTDRLEIGDFFRQLNEIYVDKGVHFSLIKCEDYDNALSGGGKQLEYDEEIRDSALSFFLFFKRIGDYTRHEFEVALDSFRKKNSPKIVTYFKYVETGEEIGDDVNDFMNMLDGQLNHYYNTYGNIDTLKLGMLMQIKLMRLDEAEVEIKNGRVTLDGETMASCDNIPMFAKNKDLQTLKDKYKELSEKTEELKRACAEGPSLYGEYSKLADERKKLEDRIREIEKNTIGLAEKMHEGAAKGVLSARQKEGYRLLEKGELKAALDVLDKDEITKEMTENSNEASLSIDKLQQNVNEYIQRAEFLSISGTTAQKKEEIGQLYKKSCEMTVQFNLDKNVLLDYVYFLREQNELKEALVWAEKAELYVKLEETDGYKTGDLYAMLAMLYETHGKAEQAEAYYKKAHETYQKFLKDGDVRLKSLIAANKLNFAAFYFRQNNLEKAISLNEEAREMFAEVLAEKDIYHYKRNYAKSLMNLSAYYHAEGDIGKALKYNTEATERLEAIFDANKEEVLPLIASARMNLSVLLREQNENDTAAKCIKTAVEYFEILADMNPKAYELSLAKAYLNMATMIDAPTKEKIEIHEKAMVIYKKYYGKNPTAFAENMAAAYKNLAALKEENGEFDQFVSMMSRSIKVLKSHINERPELMTHLAVTHHGLANRMACNNRLKQAANEYPKAVAAYRQLVKENEKYQEQLDRVVKEFDTVKLAIEKKMPINETNGNNNPGAQKNKNNQQKQKNQQKQQNQQNQQKREKANPLADGRIKKAFDLAKEGKLNEALNAYHEAANQFISMGEKGMAKAGFCCYQITGIYLACKDAAASLKYIEKAVEICETYKKNIEDADKAMIYFRYGDVLNDMEKYKEAQDAYLKSIKLREELNKKEPGRFDYEIAEAYVRINIILAKIGDYKYAAMGFALAMGLYQRVFDRGDKQALSGLANCYDNLATIYKLTGAYNDAVKSAETALEKWGWLAENVNIEYKNRAARIFGELIEIHKKASSKLPEIEKSYLMLAAMYERLAPKAPEKIYHDLAGCYVSLSNMFPGIFNRKKSKEYIAKAVSVYEKLAETNPKYNEELNKLRKKL